MIYFIRSKLSDAIKIGYSANPEERARGLSLPGTEVLASIPGDRQAETRLHKRFEHLRVGDSEWFTNAPELESFIASLNTGNPTGAVSQAIDQTMGQVSRIARLVGAMSLTLLLGGCSPGDGKTPWAIYVGLAIGGIALMFLDLLLKPKRGQPIPGTGAAWRRKPRRERLIICGALPGAEGAGPTLLLGDPSEVSIEETYNPRTGDLLGTNETVLPTAVFVPGLGLYYDVRSGTLELDERLAKTGQVSRVLKSAGGWPRLTGEEPLKPLLEEPQDVELEAKWLPVYPEETDYDR